MPIMINERKQLEIFENQLNKALDIVLAQKARYEKMQSKLNGYEWRCEEAEKNDEIAIGLLGAVGNIECAIENLYQ